MKILVISHEYPPIGGGAVRWFADICTHLAARGYSMHVLTAITATCPAWKKKAT